MAVEQKGLHANDAGDSKRQTPREFAEAYEARRGSSQSLHELAEGERRYSQVESRPCSPLVRMIPSDW
jgi:hypothetical protein